MKHGHKSFFADFLSLMFPVRVQLAKYRIGALRWKMKIVLYSGVIAIAIDFSMVLF